MDGWRSGYFTLLVLFFLSRLLLIIPSPFSLSLETHAFPSEFSVPFLPLQKRSKLTSTRLLLFTFVLAARWSQLAHLQVVGAQVVYSRRRYGTGKDCEFKLFFLALVRLVASLRRLIVLLSFRSKSPPSWEFSESSTTVSTSFSLMLFEGRDCSADSSLISSALSAFPTLIVVPNSTVTSGCFRSLSR